MIWNKTATPATCGVMFFYGSYNRDVLGVNNDDGEGNIFEAYQADGRITQSHTHV